MLQSDLENSEALSVLCCFLWVSFDWLILFSCRWSTYLPVKRIISPQSKHCLNWSLLLLWPSSSKVGVLGTASCRGQRKSCGFDIFSVTVSSCLHVSVFLNPHAQKQSSEMGMILWNGSCFLKCCGGFWSCCSAWNVLSVNFTHA